MYKLIKFILLFIFFTYGNLFAQKQGQAFIDSLLRALPGLQEDTLKVKLLNKLSYSFAEVNPDQGIFYAQKASALAQELSWDNGTASANNNLGVNYYRKSDYNKALEYYFNALKIDEKIRNNISIAQVTGNIGTVYSDLGDYPKALGYYLEALRIDEATKNKERIADITGNIGNIYFYQDDFREALSYYKKALNIYEEINNKTGIATNANNIGTVYSSLEDFPNALKYSFKSWKVASELGNKNSIVTAIGGIGEIYTRQKNYMGAIEFEQLALKLNEQIGAKGNEASFFVLIGRAYLSLITDTGSVALQKCLNPASLTEYGSLAGSDILLESLVPQSRNERLHNAIAYLDSGLELSMDIKEPDGIRNCYKSLAAACYLSGNYRQALTYYLKSMAIEDSILSKDKSDKIMKLEYENNHEADSLKMAETKKIANVKLQRQRNYTYLGIGVIVLLSGFSFFIVKERQKSEKLLLNILPAQVAAELKAIGVAKARYFDNVTVLFTDFVNFTNAGERMPPKELINELHTCFKAFDEITGKNNIEKIKTIGDAYLAVSGLPTADSCHAANVIKAAIEIRNFMHKRRNELGDNTFEIRIGVHSGNVVAGIVGNKKFSYDIWGDTIDIAVLMEHNSLPGRINISQTTYDLVKAQFNCNLHGETDAHEIKEMKMYFVA